MTAGAAASGAGAGEGTSDMRAPPVLAREAVGDGIAAGATDELIWDKSTDNGACHWDFKAVFANGEESEVVKFDFCEKNLVLEFD